MREFFIVSINHHIAQNKAFCYSFGTMKEGIHPAYFPNATVKCACGTTFTVGSTKEHIEVEICSACHPFFTGTEKIIDTAGRVEKFKTRQAKAEEKPAKKVKAAKVSKEAKLKTAPRKKSSKKS